MVMKGLPCKIFDVAQSYCHSREGNYHFCAIELRSGREMEELVMAGYGGDGYCGEGEDTGCQFFQMMGV